MHKFRRTVRLLAVLVVFGGMVSAGCRNAAAPAVTPPAATSAVVAEKVPGYLLPAERPDSAALIPPPPAPGSAEFTADEAGYAAIKPLIGTPRWQVAAADANVQFPEAANVFTCELGITVTQAATPRLYTLLQRTIIDAGQSTSAAKEKYNRTRPFIVANDATCVPAQEEVLRGSPAYPSGHASLGYVWGEVLAEVAPDQAAALRARAWQFSESRAVCRVHWQSDVAAGRSVGAAVLPILHRNPEFLADLAAAKAEVKHVRNPGTAAGRDCNAEAEALKATPFR